MRNELYGKGLTCWICNILKKPIILSGQTIGPLTNFIDKKFASFVLNKVNLITLREKKSQKILKNIDVTFPIIKVTADDAMTLPDVSQKKIDKILKNEKINKHRPFVIMNTLNYTAVPRQDLEKSKKTLSEVADYLIEKLHAQVVFIPMQHGKGYEDAAAHSDIIELIKNKDKAKVITNRYNGRISKKIIAQADLAIGARYHFIVFSTSSAVPSVGLFFDEYYSMKIRGILELMGQEKYACNITKASSIEIIELAKRALFNKDKIVKKIKARTKILKKNSLYSIQYAKKLLEEKNSKNSHD